MTSPKFWLSQTGERFLCSTAACDYRRKRLRCSVFWVVFVFGGFLATPRGRLPRKNFDLAIENAENHRRVPLSSTTTENPRLPVATECARSTPSATASLRHRRTQHQLQRLLGQRCTAQKKFQTVSGKGYRQPAIFKTSARQCFAPHDDVLHRIISIGHVLL